jgi:hypothetical protein
MRLDEKHDLRILDQSVDGEIAAANPSTRQSGE